MPDQLQLRGGTTSENLLFTGAQREVTVDTDKHTLVVHDGITPGGFPVASEEAVDRATIFFNEDTEGGSTADAYILSAKDNSLVPNQYTDGKYFGFVTTNTNTGPSTANYVELGQKNIKYADGSDPEPGDINGRVVMIYDADNDWFELQRKVGAAQTSLRTGVRQTVLTGPIDANGYADFVISGTGLQAIATGLSTTPLLLAFGDGFTIEQGDVDFVVRVDSNQIFGGLTDNETNYLYLDYDEETGTITPGATIQRPTYSVGKPSSPSSGDYWYPTDHRSRGEVYGGSWSSVLRIYIGEAVTAAGSVTSTVSYAYQGKYQGRTTADFSANSSVDFDHNIGSEIEWEMFVEILSSQTGFGYNEGDLISYESHGRPSQDSTTGGSKWADVDGITCGASWRISSGAAYQLPDKSGGSVNTLSSPVQPIVAKCRRAF